MAVILYCGGTTGITKGILLTNLNFNALGAQVLATNPMFRPGDKMLAVMPVFHGFGLGISIHTMLMYAGCCILVPRFTADSYAKLLLKYRCNFIAGVPTLYEALLRLPAMKNADLSLSLIHILRTALIAACVCLALVGTAVAASDVIQQYFHTQVLDSYDDIVPGESEIDGSSYLSLIHISTMAHRLSRWNLAADMAASHTWPSSISPSPSKV